jgi:hypothetical protein
MELHQQPQHLYHLCTMGVNSFSQQKFLAPAVAYLRSVGGHAPVRCYLGTSGCIPSEFSPFQLEDELFAEGGRNVVYTYARRRRG